MILCKLLFVGFLTQTEYTKNPFSAASLPEVACEFAPTVFSATVLALLKDICTLDSIVCDNVEESCIEPVQFELADPAEGLFFIDLVIVLLLVLPVWFLAFTCCAYVETKIPVIVDAIIDRDCNYHQISVSHLFYCSPLRNYISVRNKSTDKLRHAKPCELTL